MLWERKGRINGFSWKKLPPLLDFQPLLRRFVKGVKKRAQNRNSIHTIESFDSPANLAAPVDGSCNSAAGVMMHTGAFSTLRKRPRFT